MCKMKCLCCVFSFICGIIELFISILLKTIHLIQFYLIEFLLAVLVLKQQIFAFSPIVHSIVSQFTLRGNFGNQWYSYTFVATF